jgi:hypothetical protein
MLCFKILHLGGVPLIYDLHFGRKIPVVEKNFLVTHMQYYLLLEQVFMERQMKFLSLSF